MPHCRQFMGTNSINLNIYANNLSNTWFDAAYLCQTGPNKVKIQRTRTSDVGRRTSASQPTAPVPCPVRLAPPVVKLCDRTAALQRLLRCRPYNAGGGRATRAVVMPRARALPCGCVEIIGDVAGCWATQRRLQVNDVILCGGMRATFPPGTAIGPHTPRDCSTAPTGSWRQPRSCWSAAPSCAPVILSVNIGKSSCHSSLLCAATTVVVSVAPVTQGDESDATRSPATSYTARRVGACTPCRAVPLTRACHGANKQCQGTWAPRPLPGRLVVHAPPRRVAVTPEGWPDHQPTVTHRRCTTTVYYHRQPTPTGGGGQSLS